VVQMYDKSVLSTATTIIDGKHVLKSQPT